MTKVITSGIGSLRRVAVVGAIVATMWLMMAPAAVAGVTGPCTGTATIDGNTYDASFDTPSNPIVVPAERAGLQIPYSGSVSMTNTNYLGAVGVVIGPATVNVADWGLDENDDDIRATEPGAIYVLGSELDNLVGIYQLTAFHDADGGSCDATAFVKLDGSVLSTALGAGSTAGVIVTGAGIALAGRAKKGKP